MFTYNANDYEFCASRLTKQKLSSPDEIGRLLNPENYPDSVEIIITF